MGTDHSIGGRRQPHRNSPTRGCRTHHQTRDLELRLAKLASLPKKKITLDQAEDGVILSRRLGEKDLEKRFEGLARDLRTKRPKART